MTTTTMTDNRLVIVTLRVGDRFAARDVRYSKNTGDIWVHTMRLYSHSPYQVEVLGRAYTKRMQQAIATKTWDGEWKSNSRYGIIPLSQVPERLLPLLLAQAMGWQS